MMLEDKLFAAPIGPNPQVRHFTSLTVKDHTRMTDNLRPANHGPGHRHWHLGHVSGTLRIDGIFKAKACLIRKQRRR